MTIHKAKGLEFDTVILPGLGAVPRGDDQRLLLWLEHRGELLLAPIAESGEDKDRSIDIWKASNAASRSRKQRVCCMWRPRARDAACTCWDR
jgi:ATP-dependent exoDNAse (exonuclease V) beta subunit